mgnify:CR=1 FL=1
MKSNSFLLRQLWLHQEDFRWTALVWGAAFLILAAIEAIVCPLLSEEGAIIPIASLLGLVVGPILMAAFGGVRFTTEFGIGLQMGATRRQMVAAELWLCLCQNVEMLALELGEIQAAGMDLTITGFSAADLEMEDPNEEPPAAEDDGDSGEPDADTPSRAKDGDVWKLGDHVLLCGNCTEKPYLDKIFGGGGNTKS